MSPWLGLPTPNSGSGAASESTQPRLMPLGVTTSAPRQDTSSRSTHCRERWAEEKESFGGAGCFREPILPCS